MGYPLSGVRGTDQAASHVSGWPGLDVGCNLMCDGDCLLVEELPGVGIGFCPWPEQRLLLVCSRLHGSSKGQARVRHGSLLCAVCGSSCYCYLHRARPCLDAQTSAKRRKWQFSLELNLGSPSFLEPTTNAFMHCSTFQFMLLVLWLSTGCPHFCPQLWNCISMSQGLICPSDLL